LFKHNIIEWQNKGVKPNTDYLITQRKVKRIKTEASSSSLNNTVTEYEMVNVNYHQTTTNMNNSHQSQQIISVNQFTNQTYIINNIQADGMKLSAHASSANNQMGTSYNNNNGYFNNGWAPSVGGHYYHHPNELASVNTISSSQLMPSIGSTYTAPAAIQQQQLQQQLPITYHQQQHHHHHHQQQQLQSVSTTSTSTEDSLGEIIRDLIKSIHSFYQNDINPSLLLDRNFLINSNWYSNYNRPNHLNNNNQLVYNSYQFANAPVSAYTNQNEINNYYFLLYEILEYFRWYATRLATFLDNLDKILGK
jgi:hypothetical protein